MNLDSQGVINRIVAIARKHKHCPAILALVGSSSPLSQEVAGDGSDIDLMILQDSEVRSGFLDDLKHSVTPEWQILSTWDVVSAAAVGAPVIHVHITEVTAYARYSSLFRRAVAKYPSMIGSNLSAYAPTSPISRTELLDDRLGVNSLYRKINASRALSDHPTTDDKKDYASLIDISLYCALHSVRNTLRWLGIYEEFSPTDGLVRSWTDVNGPRSDSLQRFIGEKRKRRQGQYFTREEEHSSASECCGFLSELSEWIPKTTNRQ